MTTFIRCGSLFTGREDAARGGQTLGVQDGRITYAEHAS